MQALQDLADDGGDDGDGGGPAGPVRLRMPDPSAVRVHRHAAGARREGACPETGTGRGGRTTKVRPALSGTDAVQALAGPGPGVRLRAG